MLTGLGKHPLFPPTQGAPYFYDTDQGPKQSFATKLLDTQFSRNRTSWGIEPRFRRVSVLGWITAPAVANPVLSARHHLRREGGARHLLPNQVPSIPAPRQPHSHHTIPGQACDTVRQHVGRR